MNEQQTPPPPKAEQDQNIFRRCYRNGKDHNHHFETFAGPVRQRLEKIGIETEHKYLFEELSRRLNGAR